MPAIKELECPNCGARVTAAPGALQARCEYCGAVLALEPTQGEAQAHAAQEMAMAARTEREMAHLSLERSQLMSRYSGLEIDRDSILREAFTLERSRLGGARARRQGAELRGRANQISAELEGIRARLAQIDAVLYPGQQVYSPPPLVVSGSARSPLIRGCGYGCAVWLTMAVLLSMLLSELGMASKGPDGTYSGWYNLAMLVSLLVGAAAFYYGLDPARARRLLSGLRGARKSGNQTRT